MNSDMQGGTPLERLGREVLDKALLVSALGLPLLSSLVLANAIVQNKPTGLVIGVCIATLLFPLLWLVRKLLSFRTAAVLLLLLLGMATMALQLRGGLITATGAIPILMIVLSGLFFGRVGSLCCLLLSLLSIAVAGYAVLNDLVLPVDFSSWDPTTVYPWVRGAVALLVFGGGTATAVIFVCERLELETRDLQLAREREMATNLQKQHAEAERESAQLALAESHRLESLGRLAGGVAHDFNNILTVIMGNAELALKKPGLDEQVRNYLSEIQRASLHSSELTQELLMLSRKDPSSAKIVNVGDYLERMKPTLQRLVPDDIQLSLKVEHTKTLVRIVPFNLERMLLNLVANARDAITGAGKIDLAIRVLPANEENQQQELVMLSVRDSGSGLDEVTLKRMFEPFFTTKKAGSGSGLGLTLVQSMVLDAGGFIKVDSAPGQGTHLMLMLPRATGTNVIDDVPAAGASKQGAQNGSGRIILVVDDQLAVLSTIMATLEHAGFNVITANNGDEALKVIENRAVHFDLLCLDGVMPGASSAKVIERLKQARPGIDVVLCSGYVDEELLLRGIQVGELTCVRKPFHPRELVAAILKKLDK